MTAAARGAEAGEAVASPVGPQPDLELEAELGWRARFYQMGHQPYASNDTLFTIVIVSPDGGQVDAVESMTEARGREWALARLREYIQAQVDRRPLPRHEKVKVMPAVKHYNRPD